MNHTFTPMAARLLKVNIISPITTEKSINDRLDAVEGRIYASSACLISLRLFRTDTFRRHVQRGPISAQDARKTRPGQTNRFSEYYLPRSSDPRLRLPQFIACDPQTPAKSSTPIITRITQMLQLRNIVRNLPDLQDSLRSASSMLLQIISVVSPALDDHTV
jgi:DNA mismatch repair protein MSH4